MRYVSKCLEQCLAHRKCSVLIAVVVPPLLKPQPQHSLSAQAELLPPISGHICGIMVGSEVPLYQGPAHSRNLLSVQQLDGAAVIWQALLAFPQGIFYHSQTREHALWDRPGLRQRSTSRAQPPLFHLHCHLLSISL